MVFGEGILVVQFSVHIAMVEESHVHVLHLHTERLSTRNFMYSTFTCEYMYTFQQLLESLTMSLQQQCNSNTSHDNNIVHV